MAFSILQIQQFILGAGGIYLMYLYYGILQEKIFTTNYSQIPGEKSEKFKGASLLVLSQSLLSYILATSVNYYFNANFKSVLDNEEKFKLGFFNAQSMLMSNFALGYVSYPIQALMKSAKIMSVMVVGIIVGGKSHKPIEYLCASLITLGIVVFNLMDISKKSNDKETSSLGLVLIVASLFGDGMLAEKQNEARSKHRNRLGPYDLMAGSSLYCAFFCLLTSFFTGEIFTFYGYVKKYPLFSFDFLMLSLCGTFGQVFIFYTVNVFGPLVLSIVTTTRKFMSIVITIIYFNHPIGQYQYFAIGLVFSGIMIELYNGYTKQQKVDQSDVEEVKDTKYA